MGLKTKNIIVTENRMQVSGAAANTKVLTATGSADATWQDSSGGGGGGGSFIDVTTSVWIDLPPYTSSEPGTAGFYRLTADNNTDNLQDYVDATVSNGDTILLLYLGVYSGVYTVTDVGDPGTSPFILDLAYGAASWSAATDAPIFRLRYGTFSEGRTFVLSDPSVHPNAPVIELTNELPILRVDSAVDPVIIYPGVEVQWNSNDDNDITIVTPTGVSNYGEIHPTTARFAIKVLTGARFVTIGATAGYIQDPTTQAFRSEADGALYVPAHGYRYEYRLEDGRVLANQSGGSASIDAFDTGTVTIGGLTNMTADSVGGLLEIQFADNAGNNGRFEITAYNSEDSVDINNPAGVFPDANSGILRWAEISNPAVRYWGLVSTMAPGNPRVYVDVDAVVYKDLPAYSIEPLNSSGSDLLRITSDAPADLYDYADPNCYIDAGRLVLLLYLENFLSGVYRVVNPGGVADPFILEMVWSDQTWNDNYPLPVVRVAEGTYFVGREFYLNDWNQVVVETNTPMLMYPYGSVGVDQEILPGFIYPVVDDVTLTLEQPTADPSLYTYVHPGSRFSIKLLTDSTVTINVSSGYGIQDPVAFGAPTSSVVLTGADTTYEFFLFDTFWIPYNPVGSGGGGGGGGTTTRVYIDVQSTFDAAIASSDINNVTGETITTTSGPVLPGEGPLDLNSLALIPYGSHGLYGGGKDYEPGVYRVDQIGNESTPWIFTRVYGYDLDGFTNDSTPIFRVRITEDPGSRWDGLEFHYQFDTFSNWWFEVDNQLRSFATGLASGDFYVYPCNRYVFSSSSNARFNFQSGFEPNIDDFNKLFKDCRIGIQSVGANDITIYAESLPGGQTYVQMDDGTFSSTNFTISVSDFYREYQMQADYPSSGDITWFLVAATPPTSGFTLANPDDANFVTSLTIANPVASDGDSPAWLSDMGVYISGPSLGVIALRTLIGLDTTSGTTFTARRNYVNLIDTTSNGCTVTLPTLNGSNVALNAANGGSTIFIKKTAAANSVTIQAPNSGTIDGGVSYSLTDLNSSVVLVGNLATNNWNVVATSGVGGGGAPSGSAGGDLGGTYPNPTVEAFQSATTQINVGSATAPTSGQVLTATSGTAATWQDPTGGAPSGSAGGDLGGSYPNPTVEALQSATTSINVSAATAPTSGQVLTATSSTTATWQTPSGGGGGGYLNYGFDLVRNNTNFTGPDEIANILFNVDGLAGVVRFCAVLSCATAGQTCYLELYNITDGGTVVTINTTNTVATKVSSTTLSLPSGEKLYGARLYRDGGGTGDNVSCQYVIFENRSS